MAERVIAVAELRVRYRGAPGYAVDGITFDVARGEIFGFLGPNGAGKSTTQRVLTRMLRDYEGTAEVLGRSVRAWGPDYFEHVGVGFELPAHYSKLTARENLAGFAAFYRGPVEPVDALLDLVDLADAADRRIVTFSKGMQMRLNLARALLNRPEMLFLDEPTSGLDPVHAAAIRELIRAQADQGRTVFLTTHDMATADQLCDRVAFMAGGRIAAIDTPRNFKLAHGQRTIVVEYRAHGSLERRELPIGVTSTAAAICDLVGHGDVETVHTREASLDDVFVAVTAGAL
jgi:fluoroquinolone transport system ATP-binding protein